LLNSIKNTKSDLKQGYAYEDSSIEEKIRVSVLSDLPIMPSDLLSDSVPVIHVLIMRAMKRHPCIKRRPYRRAARRDLRFHKRPVE
jgi:hypothetical protein